MRNRLILVILITSALIACTNNETETTLIAETTHVVLTHTPSSEPVEGPTTTTGTTENSTLTDPVLLACGGAEQEQPFRDDLVPDLQSLNVNICYDLEFVLNNTQDAFDGVAHITVRNGSSDSWPDLLFRLYPHSPYLFGGEIEVGTVRVEGKEVEASRTLVDETGLRVPLATPLSPGEHVEVEIPFSGQLAQELGGSNKVYGVFARTESAVTIASWFPLLAVWNNITNTWFDVQVLGEGDAVFAESAFIRARLSAPEEFELAVSGTIIDQQPADGHITYEVVTGPARELTMTWLNEYEKDEVTVDGTLLRNWYRSDDKEGATLAMDAARESIAIFNQTFGPYPFEEVDIVEVPLAGAGGVEYPQLYLLDQGLYRDRGSHDFLAFASAHEMAHQWWYSTIGNDINAAPWQDEALTNWSAIFWLEKAQGNIASDYLKSYQQSVDRYEEKAGEEAINGPLESFKGRSNAYGVIVYLKGALFFDALRQEIGDDAFFSALQTYYNENRFAIATPDTLLTQFEQASQRSLDDLYQEWGAR